VISFLGDRQQAANCAVKCFIRNDETALWISMNTPEGVTCRTCGQCHVGIPFSFAADFPDAYANFSKEERDGAIIGTDQCILDAKWFFLRGILEIAVVGSDGPFLWGVWASAKEAVSEEISDSWELDGRETRPF
jgi:hypothetical protein